MSRRPASAAAERRLALWLCAPAVAALGLVAVWPIAYSVWLSLQRYDLRFPDERHFVGLANYADVLGSELWWSDLATTLLLTVASVGCELVLGMGMALVMHRALFARRIVRASVLVPYAIVTVVAALAWRHAFDPSIGFVNGWLGSERAWLSARSSALVVILAAEVWKTTPFMALLLLAGLALVPENVQSAARIDGASAWQRFFRVTLPIMKPTLVVALLFRSVDAFRIFDSVYVMTRGSMGTETVSILAFAQLLGRLNLGIGSAVAVLIFLCVAALALAILRGFAVAPTRSGRGAR
ncbi:MAG: sugar ABC transporter permease [Myxococcales bacterium]|nr:MAG: sugar ABC transporter permease [Myxococcales bacterium]